MFAIIIDVTATRMDQDESPLLFSASDSVSLVGQQESSIADPDPISETTSDTGNAATVQKVTPAMQPLQKEMKCFDMVVMDTTIRGQ